jgi:hypothetical protein
MKRSSLAGIVIAALTLMAGLVLLCAYAGELKRLLKTFWDALESKRANLKLYMQ